MKTNEFLILNIEDIATTPNREMALRNGFKFELRAWNNEGAHSRLIKRYKSRKACENAITKLCA